MDREIFKKIHDNSIERYQTRYYKEGETPKALGWRCKADQIERFQNLCKYMDIDGNSIMDLGCGFADLYGYLKQKGIPCHYIGVDIVPEFVENCKVKYPEAEFICADIFLDCDLLPRTDFVITMGTLNFKQKIIDNMVYARTFMELAFSKAKKKLSMDFLSEVLTSGYPKEELVYYYSPAKVLELALEQTENVELIHNYRPVPQKEFMLILSK